MTLPIVRLIIVSGNLAWKVATLTVRLTTQDLTAKYWNPRLVEMQNVELFVFQHTVDFIQSARLR